MGQELVGWFFTAPLITGAVLAIAPYYAPAVRWTRRLKNDIAIRDGLPDGPLRDKYTASIEALALRLHAYRYEVPGWEKFFAWLAFGLGLFALFSALSWGVSIQGPMEVGFMIGGTLTSIIGAIAVFTGRSMNIGATPERYRAVREYEFSRMRRAEARRLAWKRLRRIRRAERKAAKAARAAVLGQLRS